MVCDFGEIRTTLVLDMFILHMSNKKVREKFCTEHKDPEQALEFAVVEGVKRQKVYRTQACESTINAVKSEPGFAVERTNPRGCNRYGKRTS